MKIQNKNLGDDLLIIAEVGNNHEGSYSLAEELVGLAAEAGADAVKFQTFRTDHFSPQPMRRVTRSSSHSGCRTRNSRD